MFSKGNQPEISLITSWFVPVWKPSQPISTLTSLKAPLRAGLNLLDLYFLNHVEIPWYAQAAGRETSSAMALDPHRFVASLTAKELDAIAQCLLQELTDQYGGLLIGPRPRYCALATYFPYASLPAAEEGDGVKRADAVQSLQKTLYLAAKLGCH